MKLPWKRGKDKHREVEATLNQEEERSEHLARRLRSLQLELGLTQTARTRRSDA